MERLVAAAAAWTSLTGKIQNYARLELMSMTGMLMSVNREITRSKD